MNASGKSATAGAEQPVSAAATPQVQKIPFWRVVVSVFQAAFGVQSPGNRERDFVHGKAFPFIIAGLLFTGLFVLMLVLVVNLVLS